MMNKQEIQEFYVLLGAFFNNATVDQIYTHISTDNNGDSIVFNYDRVIFKDFVKITNSGLASIIGKGRGAWDCEDAINKIQDKCRQRGVFYRFNKNVSDNFNGTWFVTFALLTKDKNKR